MLGGGAGRARGSCHILHEGGPGRPADPCRAGNAASCSPRGGARGIRRRTVCGKLARGGGRSADRSNPSRGRVFCCRPLVTSLVALMFLLCQTRTSGSFVAQGGGTDGLIGMWPLRGLRFNRTGCRMRGGGFGGRLGLGTDCRGGGRRLCSVERSGGEGPEGAGGARRFLRLGRGECR